jgi:hypothetical protein
MGNPGSTGRGLLTAKYIRRDEATRSWRGDGARPSLRRRERPTRRLGVPGGAPIGVSGGKLARSRLNRVARPGMMLA